MHLLTLKKTKTEYILAITIQKQQQKTTKKTTEGLLVVPGNIACSEVKS